MLEEDMRYQLAELAELKSKELRKAFAASGLDYDCLDWNVCCALVADAMVNDTASAAAKYQRWASSQITWDELTADARAAGAPV